MALKATHARSRERFLALRDIADGACATQVAARTGRHPQTVMGWLHAYNEHGPEALKYQRTGGRPIGAKIALDPARTGTILGADAKYSICSDGPVLRVVEASPGRPRP